MCAIVRFVFVVTLTYCIYCMSQVSSGKTTYSVRVSKDCVTMTGNECPDISALCQGTSERLPVGVERVSPDEPCQSRGGLGAPLSKQINIATRLLYLQACNYKHEEAIVVYLAGGKIELIWQTCVAKLNVKIKNTCYIRNTQ